MATISHQVRVEALATMQVYKAYRNQVEPVAVKVLKGQQDERSQAHFMREVELLRKMRHSNIVLCAHSHVVIESRS